MLLYCRRVRRWYWSVVVISYDEVLMEDWDGFWVKGVKGEGERMEGGGRTE